MIESRFGFPEPVRRQAAWRLRDLCAWLCPAIDVSLFTEQDGTSEVSVRASDWEILNGADLLRRLLLHRDDVHQICVMNYSPALSANMRDVRDANGQLLGRAAIRRCIIPGGSTKEPINQASAATAGSFRAFEQIETVGLFVGRPNQVARFTARPIAFDCPQALAVWATEQAGLVPQLTNDPMVLMHYAGLIRVLGGTTCGLPIARTARGRCSFDDIARRRDLPDEVLLYEEYWGTGGGQELPENAIGVGNARMKTLYDVIPAHDPMRRANHPRWTQYWMSLWGAVIEAIAKAWGVPLQAVLESSEISSSRSDGLDSAEFPKKWVTKIDRIRNPRRY